MDQSFSYDHATSELSMFRGGDISVIRVTGANLIIVVGDTDIYLVISQLGLHFEQNSEPNRWNHGPPKAPRQLTPS